jgi:hypothetical protein
MGQAAVDVVQQVQYAADLQVRRRPGRLGRGETRPEPQRRAVAQALEALASTSFYVRKIVFSRPFST